MLVKLTYYAGSTARFFLSNYAQIMLVFQNSAANVFSILCSTKNRQNDKKGEFY